MSNSTAVYGKAPQIPASSAWTESNFGDILHQRVNMRIHDFQSSPAFSSHAFGDTAISWVDSKDVFFTELQENEAHELAKCQLLSRKLEDCLKDAKGTQLQCTEVLIPSDLMLRIVRDILRMSEKEPCGLRGCVVYVNLEEKSLCRRIGKVNYDPDTVATFEVFLTLKQDCSSWLSLRHLIPARLLKSLGRNSPLVISENYMLSKKKLYRSYSLH
ncbi:DNA damage-inducible transcript 4-like protein [Limulus polyphemus]|uniref:DNA damage-inducible transcript 4-like protein n=1 Tax=Limulus polyphemus TaxID=6850 RepID=A0ABM1B0U3_LIMPO|nr:DNA damage-inducible transcript 4-like protein [Limulus polyphemus]